MGRCRPGLWGSACNGRCTGSTKGKVRAAGFMGLAATGFALVDAALRGFFAAGFAARFLDRVFLGAAFFLAAGRAGVFFFMP